MMSDGRREGTTGEINHPGLDALERQWKGYRLSEAEKLVLKQHNLGLKALSQTVETADDDHHYAPLPNQLDIGDVLFENEAHNN